MVAIPEHLARQIIIDPDDHELYLVLADVLSAHGDSRGELIVAAVRLHSDPTDLAVRARHDELLARLRTEFEQAVGLTSPSLAAQATEWRLGFVHRLSLDDPRPEQLRAALSHPSARLLHGLALRLGDAYRDVLDVLFERPRAGLRELSLRSRNLLRPHAGGSRDWSRLDDLDQLGLAGVGLVVDVGHPYLRRLALAGHPIDAPTWDLPRLHKLQWVLLPHGSPAPYQLQRACRLLPRSLQRFVVHCDEDDERLDGLRGLPCNVEVYSHLRSR